MVPFWLVAPLAYRDARRCAIAVTTVTQAVYLTSTLIDRTVNPLVRSGWFVPVQVGVVVYLVVTVMESQDQSHDLQHVAALSMLSTRHTPAQVLLTVLVALPPPQLRFRRIEESFHF